jgi:outer membrane protein assembly factor BamA
MVSFAITQHLRISGGVSLAELDPFETDFDAPFGSSMANVAIGSIGYSLQRNEHKGTEGPWHDFEASFTARSGTKGLESDYVYTRSLGQAQYKYEFGEHQILVSGMAGAINGTAPLFERFTLGDARTLRGWDKYDIAPAGADRMYHGSLEYRFSVLQLFVDVGSVWNKGVESKIRASTGVGVVAGPVFMTVGVPLNTSDLRAVFMMGFRFGSFGFQKN